MTGLIYYILMVEAALFSGMGMETRARYLAERGPVPPIAIIKMKGSEYVYRQRELDRKRFFEQYEQINGRWTKKTSEFLKQRDR
jgi:hypothetical protein